MYNIPLKNILYRIPDELPLSYYGCNARKYTGTFEAP